MKSVTSALLVLLAIGVAGADTMVLKDGSSIQWTSLRDNGDTYEVQLIDGKTVTVQKKDVKEIKVVLPPAAPLTGATFTGDGLTKSLTPVNLLPLVELKHDGNMGQWKNGSQGLTGAGGAQGANLEIPYTPPDEYDLELIAERSDGDGNFMVGLVGGGHRFSIDFDGPGAACGIRMIDGRYPYENESGVQVKVFTDRKPHRIICAVRKDRVVALVDGKEIFSWKADYKRVSISNNPGPGDKKGNLFFSMANASIRITKAVIVPKK